VVVTGPDGASWADGPAVGSGSTVTQALRPMTSGAYSVPWRSVAADGHPVSGTFGFTVDLPVPPAPAVTATAHPEPAVATPAPQPTVDPVAEVAEVAVDDEARSSGLGSWAWVVVAAVALAALGSLAFAL